jgi:putative ABC transport system substrate-binding protein
MIPPSARRRGLLAALGVALLPRLAQAQMPASKRIGLLSIGTPGTFLGREGGRAQLYRTLASHGWEKGRNLAVEERFVSDPQQLARGVAELVSLKLDAIVTEGTLTTAALQKATHSIPIVTTVADPIGSGFARDLRRPGGNVTGHSQGRIGAARKQLELLRLLKPGVRRIAMVYEEPFPSVELYAKPLFEAAREVGIEARRAGFAPKDLAAVLDRLAADRVDALFGPGMNPGAIATASGKGFVVVGADPSDIEQGALFSLGPGGTDTAVRIADTVAKILRGTPPGDIPFDEENLYRLDVNAKAAARLGIRVPPEVRIRAERVIE